MQDQTLSDQENSIYKHEKKPPSVVHHFYRSIARETITIEKEKWNAPRLEKISAKYPSPQGRAMFKWDTNDLYLYKNSST